LKKQIIAYEALQVKGDSSIKIEDMLVMEAALQININREAYTVVMRTPGDDFDLIRGLLYAEDIYKGDNLQLEIVSTAKNGFAIINASISKEDLGKGYLNKRTLLSVSSCGICGKQQLDDIDFKGSSLQNAVTLKLSDIEKMYQKMKLEQLVFRSTGGSHATAAFDNQGKLLSIKEDIGRHNALDKVVGQLLKLKKLNKVACILVSGRVSYEIVSKAFIAKIPIIAAVSACSSLAVDYAKEFGICLIGFSREKKATIYANSHYTNL